MTASESLPSGSFRFCLNIPLIIGSTPPATTDITDRGETNGIVWWVEIISVSLLKVSTRQPTYGLNYDLNRSKWNKYTIWQVSYEIIVEKSKQGIRILLGWRNERLMSRTITRLCLKLILFVIWWCWSTKISYFQHYYMTNNLRHVYAVVRGIETLIPLPNRLRIPCLHLQLSIHYDYQYTDPLISNSMNLMYFMVLEVYCILYTNCIQTECLPSSKSR